MITILNAFIIAAAAYVWVFDLTSGKDDIFGWFPGLVEKIIPVTGRKEVWRMRVHKVLYQCERCFAGQLALWFYIFGHPGRYNVAEHFVLIVLSIFFAGTITSLRKR